MTTTRHLRIRIEALDVNGNWRETGPAIPIARQGQGVALLLLKILEHYGVDANAVISMDNERRQLFCDRLFNQGIEAAVELVKN